MVAIVCPAQDGEGVYERKSIDGAETQYAFFNRCEAGDLIVNKIWARSGSVGVVQNELSGCFVSNEFPLYTANSCILPKWLRIITKATWFWQECHLKAQGTSGKNRIKPIKFLEIRIPLPPLAEQQRIVAHLDAIEQRLKRIQRLREESEKELLAALRSTFHQIEADANWLEMGEVAPLVRREVAVEPHGSYSFGTGLPSRNVRKTARPCLLDDWLDPSLKVKSSMSQNFRHRRTIVVRKTSILTSTDSSPSGASSKKQAGMRQQNLNASGS